MPCATCSFSWEVDTEPTHMVMTAAADLPVDEKLTLLLPPEPTLLYPSLLETHRTIAGGLGHAHGDGGHRRGRTSPATGCSASSTVWMSSLSTFLGAGLVVVVV